MRMITIITNNYKNSNNDNINNSKIIIILS